MTHSIQYPSKPFPNSYWLMPNKILAGEVPIASDPQFTDRKVEALLNSGIQVFINLIQEPAFNYEETLNRVAQQQKIQVEYFSFPIRDFDIPTGDFMKEILDTIDKNVKEQKPVYFHCYAGLGRTGITAGCWIARHCQLTDEGIVRFLWNLRKKQNHLINHDSPQTAEQLQMVFDWEFRK